MDNFYDILSPYYDVLQEDADPSHFSKTCDDLIKKHCNAKGDGEDGKKILCDLGCGNGRVTVNFKDLGYEVIGIDSSIEMLDSAREIGEGILWLCQDITDIDLFGSCDVFVSLLDTVNHITDEEGIRKIFGSFRNFLNEGGLFIFDIGTYEHFSKTLGDQVFFEDYDEFTLLWNNSFDEETGMNLAELTLFEKTEDETYVRYDGVIEERFYDEDFFIKTGEKEGLKLVDRVEDGERVFLAFRKETI